MCMKNFNAEKIIFDKFTAFLTLPIIDHYVYRIMVDSAYFLKSTPPRVFSVYYYFYIINTLQVCYRHIEDVHEEF